MNTFILPQNYPGFYKIKVIRVNLNDSALRSIYFYLFKKVGLCSLVIQVKRKKNYLPSV